MAFFRTTKSVLAFCLPFFLVYFVLTVSSFLLSSFTKELGFQIGRNLNMPVALEGVHLSLSKGLVLTRLSFMDKEGHRYTIRNLSLQAIPRDLLKRKIVIRSIEVNDVSIDP